MFSQKICDPLQHFKFRPVPNVVDSVGVVVAVSVVVGLAAEIVIIRGVLEDVTDSEGAMTIELMKIGVAPVPPGIVMILNAFRMKRLANNVLNA